MMRTFKRRVANVAGIFAAAMIASLVVVGCSDDDDNNNNGAGRDSRLILPSGQAWVGTIDYDGCDEEDFCFEFPFNDVAVSFNSDGTLETYFKVFGVWVSEADMNIDDYLTTWHTIDNKELYIVYADEWETDTTFNTYAISGNTLTIVDPEDGMILTLTKQAFDPDVDVEADPALLNMIFIDILGGGAWGFMQQGPFYIAVYLADMAALSDSENILDGIDAYFWRTESGMLYLTPIDLEYLVIQGSEVGYAYSVVGTALTLDGKTYAMGMPFDPDQMFKGGPGANAPKIKLPEINVRRLFK